MSEFVTVNVPMAFRRRGGRKTIILPEGTPEAPEIEATIDDSLIKAVARAYRWQRLIENNTYSCLDDIARAEKISLSFVSRIFRLALLAPDIVEVIVDGQCSAKLTLTDFKGPFPVEWTKQNAILLQLS